MIGVLITLLVYAAVGGIVWLVESITFPAGIESFLCWPLVVVEWIDEGVEWLINKLDHWSG